MYKYQNAGTEIERRSIKAKKKKELKSPKGVYQHVHSIISQNHLQSVILGYKLKP